MIDLHSHILPYLDDGAKSLEESLAMARIAVEEGIETMVATPHYLTGAFTPSVAEIQQAGQQLAAALGEEGIPLEIQVGAEIFLDLAMVDWLEGGEAASIASGGRYVLMELPMGELPSWTEDVFHALQVKGFSPILAHPERYRAVVQDRELVLGWVEQGLLLQINSGSLLGKHGREARRTALELLDARAVHFVGSDAHSPRGRAPRMKEAAALIRKRVGQTYAEEILSNNAALLLAGEEPVRREVLRRKRGFWSFIMSRIGV